VARDAIAEALDESVNDIGVPDPPIERTRRRAQLAASWDTEAVVLVAERSEHADILDIAGEAQIVVQRVCDDRAGSLLSRKYDAGDGVAARLQICPKAWCVGANC
jgi:hypothetical protein